MSAAAAGPSRGGAGGRGGGRGRGRGRGAGAGSRLVTMGNMTMSDLTEVQATHGTGRHGGRLPYPPMDAAPEVAPPTESEAGIVDATLEFMRAQHATPWWIREAGTEEASAALSASAAAASGNAEGAAIAAAALAKVSSKRGATDVLRYSDRKRLREAAELAAANDGATKDAVAVQGPQSLNDAAVLRLLYRESFPMDLWRTYMRRETRRQEQREGTKPRKGGSKRSLEDVLARLEGSLAAGDGDALNDNTSEPGNSEDEEDAAADEYEEDDEEDDYADNYFDNGEEDDVADLGAGEAEGDYD